VEKWAGTNAQDSLEYLILISQSNHPLVRYFLIFNALIRPFMRVTETVK